MSTFVDLVNAARVECLGAAAATPVTTLQGTLTADVLRFKTWVARAFLRVQTNRPDWDWMRATATFNTVAANLPTTPGQVKYSPTDIGVDTTLGTWFPQTFRCSTPGLNYADEVFMTYMPWDPFRDSYIYGNLRNSTSRPMVMSIFPTDQSVYIWAQPDNVYQIQGDYYMRPQQLVGDLDDPTNLNGLVLPERFNDLMVFDAMQRYGARFAAPETADDGAIQYRELYASLIQWGLPTMQEASTLA